MKLLRSVRLASSLVLSVFLIHTASASDERLLAARDAARLGDRAKLEAIAPEVQGHELAAYVDYWLFQIDLKREDADPAAIKSFLTRNEGSYIAERMRGDWLKKLGSFSPSGLLAMSAGLIALVVMLAMGIVTEPDLAHALIPGAIYLGLHTLEGQIITPVVLGKRMAISPLLLMIALMVFGWAWGIVGLLLAVPLLVCLKIVLAKLDGMEGWARLME